METNLLISTAEYFLAALLGGFRYRVLTLRLELGILFARFLLFRQCLEVFILLRDS